MKLGAVLLALILAVPALARGEVQSRAVKIAQLEALLVQHPDHPRVLSRLVKHNLLRADEDESVEGVKVARQWIARLARVLPGAAEPDGWSGLARCIEAKYGSGATAKSLALDGLKLLDDALARESDNLRIRLMRASVSLKVPREWGRLPQARDDLLWIDLAIRRDRSRVKTYDLEPAEVYFKLGQSWQAAGDLIAARTAWNAALCEEPASRWAREARRQLGKNGP